MVLYSDSRPLHRAVEPRPLRAEHQPVVRREPLLVLGAAIGRLAREVGQGAARRRRRQPVVGQRERRVRVHRRLKPLHRVEVAAGPELALAERGTP